MHLSALFKAFLHEITHFFDVFLQRKLSGNLIFIDSTPEPPYYSNSRSRAHHCPTVSLVGSSGITMSLPSSCRLGGASQPAFQE